MDQDTQREDFREADTIRKDDSLPAANALGDDEALIGTTLDGRYLVKRKLGHGGFGAVYLALDEKMMSRRVVVKVLREEKISHEWSVKKFKQEVEAMARIDHPSIVGIFDSGQMSDGKPYIVMQYVDGVSLRSLMRAEGMDFNRAANLLRQIGKALNAAHDHGILHRDLKPENIMVQKLTDGDEQIKIIDFGIAKVKDSVISANTGTDGAVGTVAYMSPEQLSARPVTTASDVYSFAVIAYEMLTGRRPMNPDSAYQLLELQRSGVRIKPRDLRPNIQESAEAIILKALSFEPNNRYERARDFGDILSAALIGDDEQTKLADSFRVVTPVVQQAEPSLATAHVLFMDIVGYSRLLIDEQTENVRKLQQLVLATTECSRAENEKNLIRLPTGDGMALVFSGDPEAPVRCAIEISRELKKHNDIELRMGVHSGLVYQLADINTNMNVAGGGINIAQRVMDCGDGGHILLSKRVADDLGQLARWSNYLHDLGHAEVKHGVKVHVFNLCGDDFGNSELPAKFQQPAAKPIFKRGPAIAIASVAVLALAVAGTWYALRHRGAIVNPPVTPAPVAAAGPEQSFTYWLTVQQMLKDEPLGPTFESSGQETYGNGWKFQFNVSTAQQGALYLLNEGPGPTGATEYDILFPTPANNRGNAQIATNQTVQTSWNYFVAHEGLEKFWIIWAGQPITELDAIFKNAASHQGVVDQTEVAKLRTFLKESESASLEAKADKAKNRTFIKGRGDVLVKLIELSHRAY